MSGFPIFCELPAVEENLAAIILRSHREVDPIGRAALLQNQFIKVTLRTIGDIQQYSRHPDHVFRAIAADIHRTARQVIRALGATTQPVHLLAPIPAINNYWSLPIPIQFSITIAEILQPSFADTLQIFYRDTRRDILIQHVITCFRQLSERKVLGEFHVLVYFYFSHFIIFSLFKIFLSPCPFVPCPRVFR